MKKVLLVGEDYFDFADRVKFAFEKLGYEVYLYNIPILKSKGNMGIIEYIKYKKNKIFKKKYQEKSKQNLNFIIEEFKPDIFFAINPNYYYELIDTNTFECLARTNDQCKKVIKYDDSIKRQEEFTQHLDKYDEIFVFESEDIEYINNKYGLVAKLLTSSASDITHSMVKSFCKNTYKYDICFVGNQSEERCELLEGIAKYCSEQGLKLIVIGQYYNNKMSSKLKFKKRYPYLFPYVKNHVIPAEDALRLYAESKICLNIHISCHKSFNSRTFDVMLGENFLLSDYRENHEKYGFINNQNIVFYTDECDCLNKIDYYLKEDSKRESIAKNGAKLTEDKFLMSKILSRYF